MAGFIEGVDRGQAVPFPERLEDWIGEDHLVRVVDLFVDERDLPGLGFVRSAPARTGRPGYHPAVLLKLFIYGDPSDLRAVRGALPPDRDIERGLRRDRREQVQSCQ